MPESFQINGHTYTVSKLDGIWIIYKNGIYLGEFPSKSQLEDYLDWLENQEKER